MYEIDVASTMFKGKRLVQQHQMVNNVSQQLLCVECTDLTSSNQFDSSHSHHNAHFLNIGKAR